MANGTKSFRIALAGGGTGGHVFPLLSLIRSLRKIGEARGLNFDILIIAPDNAYRHVFLKENVRYTVVPAGKLRRYFSLSSIADFFKSIMGFFAAQWTLWSFMPDVLVGKGGYGAFWPVMISSIFRVPIVVHESDSIPGLVNRVVGKVANVVSLSFDHTQEYFPPKTQKVVVGTPVRRSLVSQNRRFDFSKDRKIILVLGGSQGARQINDLIIKTLPDLLPKYDVYHQAGEKNIEFVEDEANSHIPQDLKSNYHPAAFYTEEQLANLYAKADFIVARAGSTTIFEIAANGIPSLMVPLLGSASDHQEKNAYLYAKSGAALVLEKNNLAPHLFLERVNTMLEDPSLLAKMHDSALAFARPDASDKLAEQVVTVLQ